MGILDRLRKKPVKWIVEAKVPGGKFEEFAMFGIEEVEPVGDSPRPTDPDNIEGFTPGCSYRCFEVFSDGDRKFLWKHTESLGIEQIQKMVADKPVSREGALVTINAEKIEDMKANIASITEITGLVTELQAAFGGGPGKPTTNIMGLEGISYPDFEGKMPMYTHPYMVWFMEHMAERGGKIAGSAFKEATGTSDKSTEESTKKQLEEALKEG